jgi:RNA polymerase subunit RPABC4/transcription elongation factor Spt4
MRRAIMSLKNKNPCFCYNYRFSDVKSRFIVFRVSSAKGSIVALLFVIGFILLMILAPLFISSADSAITWVFIMFTMFILMAITVSIISLRKPPPKDLPPKKINEIGRQKPNAMKTCPYCRTPISEQARYCPLCGGSQPSYREAVETDRVEAFICPHCSAKIAGVGQYCPQCGQKIKE